MNLSLSLLLSIFLLIGIISNAVAQKQHTNSIEKLNFKTKSTTPSNGGIESKYGLNYKIKTGFSLEDMARAYFSENIISQSNTKSKEGIRLKKISETPGGNYVYIEQVVNDIPVFNTSSSIAFNRSNEITTVHNNFRPIDSQKSLSQKVEINAQTALLIAQKYLGADLSTIGDPTVELIYFDSVDKGVELAWQIHINSMKPMGDWLIIINALNKRIIHVEDLARYHDGSGMIYNPNPLTTAETSYGGNYIDNDDMTNSALNKELIQVTLRDITLDSGLYKLEGPYCVLEDIELPNDALPALADPNGFNFTRNETDFESVMVYYHIDKSSRRIEELGYDIVALRTFRADPHGLAGNDNSHYIPSQNYVSFGEGGVDDAEDADVIWHEFGHAIQENLGAGIGLNTNSETESVLEGCSDYWAASYSHSLSSFGWETLFNWDGQNKFWKGRRADLDWVYPADYVSGHNGGQILSSAFMSIWEELGKEITDQLFLEMHFLWGLSPTMQGAAAAFIQADRQLYDGDHLCVILEHLRAHGLTTLSDIITLSNQTYSSDTTYNSCEIITNNINVINSAKLLLQAREVTIDSIFEVLLFSELEIR